MISGALLALIAHQAGVDWAALPSLPYRAPPLITPAMHDFAGREARARRCPLPAAAGRAQTITVELAMLVEGNGEVRTVVPRAIDCATVEQYAAGLAAAFARNNLPPRTATGAQWYKTSLTFSWPK